MLRIAFLREGKEGEKKEDMLHTGRQVKFTKKNQNKIPFPRLVSGSC